MKVLWINIDKKTVEPLDMNQDMIVDALRHRMGIPKSEGIVSTVVEPGVVLWLHDRGLVQPDPKLWSIGDAVYAGPGVVMGINPVTAQFKPPPEVTVRWRDDIRLAGIDEELRVVQTPQGFAPILDRKPRFEAIAPNGADPLPAPIRLWTVYTSGSGFRALQYEISSSGHKVVGEAVEAKDKETLYALIELDEETTKKYERDPRDDPSVVETWVLNKGQ